jgi:hypothetical protein
MSKRRFKQVLYFKIIIQVARLAKEKIEPHVKEMEKREDVLPEIKDLLFNNGVSFYLRIEFMS